LGFLAIGAAAPVGDVPSQRAADVSAVPAGFEPDLPATPLVKLDELRPLEPIGTLAPPPASRALGLPNDGRLAGGVQLPASGDAWFTFDSALRRSPSRGWRRWGTRLTIDRTIDVMRAFHAAHPRAARLGVADISRPHGGAFDSRYGGLGHASHQNGRDIDIYYPRKDHRERPPRTVGQIDKHLAQELVDRFVKAGATFVFVGPHTGLHGKRGVVLPLSEHDDHMHVRWPAPGGSPRTNREVAAG
jgi:murein endopeptidase